MEIPNSQIVDNAIERLRNPDSFEKQVYDSNIVKWLPALDISSPHPLDPSGGEKLRLAEEVFSYFKETHPKNPYDAFIKHMNSMTPIGHEPKVHQVLRSIRLLRTARKAINELNMLGLNP